ncbi:MAG: SIS domain-containing protein, partial [Terriglobia bacterium]
MNVRTALAQEARGLESIFASRRPYETAVRHARWTEGPINLIGAGPARLAGLAGAWLLEWLLGWPAAARSVAAFRHYSIPMLRPRSLLIVISPSGAGEETIEAVRLAQKHGARVLAMSRDPASPLAQMATDLFLLPGEDEAPPQIATPFLEHAAMVYVGLAASSTFNPRHPVVDDMEE